MEMITDRTHSDCERAEYIIGKVHAGEILTDEERAEYFGGLRGCYTMFHDWNRVEEVVRNFSVNNGLGLVTKTDWSYTDIASQEEIERYLTNIAIVYNALEYTDGLPELPTVDRWIDYRAANDIEKIMERANDQNAGYAILDVSGVLDTAILS